MIFKFKKKYSLKENKDKILYYEYDKRIKWIKKAKSIIVLVSLKAIYFFFLRIDILYNCIKFKNSINELDKSSNSIEKLVLSYTFVGIIFYVVGSIFNNIVIDRLFLEFFVWRIFNILIIRLNEISTFKKKDIKYISFFRTFLFFIINLIEIVVGYSFLYTSSLFKIFPDRTFATILKTLNIFTNWNISNVDELCSIQILLILSQIFVFITIISVLLSNLYGLKYKQE